MREAAKKITEQLVESLTRPFRPFKLRELPVKASLTLYESEQFTLPGSFDKTAIDSLKYDHSSHFTCKLECMAPITAFKLFTLAFVCSQPHDSFICWRKLQSPATHGRLVRSVNLHHHHHRLGIYWQHPHFRGDLHQPTPSQNRQHVHRQSCRQ